MTVKPNIDLTPKATLALLKECVEERGKGYVYPPSQVDGLKKDSNCVYAKGGAPSCLVGLALHKVGISLSALVRFDKHKEAGIPSELVSHGLLDIPLESAEILDRAQSLQDQGETWGEALKGARELAKTYNYVK